MVVEIAYQNKDIVSKLFGDRMKGKSLSLFGLKTNLKVVDTRPTNIPIVEARELRIDHLFELEDGSIAILDYESSFKESNFTKYGRYILNVIDHYLGEGKRPDIHMMVLYTADISRCRASLHRTACDIRVETSNMTDAPSEQWLEEVNDGITNGTITEETLMHLILLPLTFTDKIIDEDTKKYIKEALKMTRIASELIEEGRQEGRREGREENSKKIAFKMYEKKYSLEHIAEIIDFPINTIQEWLTESYSKI